MLKKAASFVLASLRGSTYGEEYAFTSSLAAAALDGLFDHPAGSSDAVREVLPSCLSRMLNRFFSSLIILQGGLSRAERRGRTR
jgi:hypothetical protein